MAYVIRIIISVFLIIIFSFFAGINLRFNGPKENGIINVKCKCKYHGPFFGKIIEKEKNEPVKEGLLICWWDLKRKAPSGEIFFETIKILKTNINEEGKFMIPKYSAKKDNYICCPKAIFYHSKYFNLFDFSKKDCFKKEEGCIIYLKKLSDEEKAEILKIIPADVREILKGSLSNYEKKNNLIGENR